LYIDKSELKKITNGYKGTNCELAWVFNWQGWKYN